MKARVVLSEQVKSFLESLAPEPRRCVWRAIKELAHDKGDIKQLEGKLAPYWRLRVGRVRVVYDQRAVRGSGGFSVFSRSIAPRCMRCWSNCWLPVCWNI